MKISDISVDRPVAITMVVMLVLLIGAVSLTKLPIDLMPELDLPYAVVSTSYSGAGPEEIEKSVTRPVEEAVATVDGIKNVMSMSNSGNSMVILEFDWGSDLDFVTLDLREKLSLIEDYLPDTADKPMVLKFNPNQMPIMKIGLSGDNNLDNLKSIAEDLFKPNLEKIPGVASVDISGGLEREIQINVDQEKLIAYGLTLDSVASSVRQSNLDMSGGTINKGNKELILKTVAEFESVDEIKNLEIITSQGQKIALADIATVEDTYKDVHSYTYLNGEKSIGLSIQKQSGTNTVKVANAVKAELAKLTEQSAGIHTEIITNQAEFIEDSIANVQRNAVAGAILAVIILLIFLKDIRSTIIIGTAIPISIIAAFVLMYFADLSLNMMTLGGIALGVGMLVDNAIVVLENIYRHRQESEGIIEAAKRGTAEVGSAILASTLTTAAVFLPISFVQGLASELFGPLALTVTFSLVASLLVALTLIPMLSAKLLKVKDKDKFTSREQEFQFGAITRGYQGVLRWCIHHKYIVSIVMIVGLILFGLGIKTKIIPLKSEFMPATDQGAFTVSVNLAEGTNLAETNKVMKQVEDKLYNIKEIDVVYTSVGGSGGFGGASTNTGSISVELVDLKQRDRSTDQVVEEVREKVKNIAGANIWVMPQTSMMGGGGGNSSAIEIVIQGSDLEQLSAIGDQILAEVKEVEGSRNADISLEESKPEVQVVVKRKIAKELGFSEAQIASTVSNAVKGQVISQYKEAGEEYDITLKLKDSETDSINRLKDLKLTSMKGIIVPLAQVAEVRMAKGPNTIERENQQRKVTVSSDLYGRSLSEVLNDIKARVNQLNIPAGYTIDYTGEAEQMQETFGDLGLALVMAVILVYMVMAAQFESLIHPFTIMFTMPLALVGAILGLALTGLPLSVPGFIGMIMLAGIVVNNAIVMIDYINTRREFEDRETAILKAGPIRLRPIMMTTLTTVLGLLPLGLGIGEGAESQQPMAVVVIAGLLFSTVLTLLIIPAIYTIFDDLTSWVKGIVARVLHGKEESIEV
ncbi:CzcA family heavy metal efflux pump/hydrophobe/amphiphile efflux-1 (HAE1) family protein [Orenia metallireducens]|uniref:Heavy metal efflux pump, CzcA family/hydrophobe/amphiphile efflux-1 (HAE1) family protein n=1 Tax=Orenia metallireducens TaxID=1413210 RepID=A0A285IEW8_9FIRM|nr:efflux RND transporter permease subunit [Orenia metallireducens]PRX18513.1 CzcA family heavy metal efflux pump/hydrophobe/amphiphile efflux-1 (HAE1) family protein [Orenia metallireducens]SNY46519.1 heavy metal efflux pump, CzcA family/hydrophobe/amphiphile efflux-1 (HAE1) family protein [Orenia metallireducens]